MSDEDLSFTSEEEEEEDLNCTFPISFEWILDKHIATKDLGDASFTKKYKFPGFPSFYYLMTFVVFDEERADYSKFEFTFECSSHFDTKFTVDVDLNFVVNDDGKPKNFCCTYNIFDYYDKVILWKDAIEKLTAPENGYFPNDQITVRLNGKITLRNILTWPFLWMQDRSEFSKLDEGSKDFTIVAENQEIKVHKAFLQKYSTVFARMFENEKWKETIESRIVIPDFSFKIVKIFFDLWYDSRIIDFDLFEFLNLFMFADKYDINVLKERLKEYDIHTPNNVCEYANYYFKHNCGGLVNHCIDNLMEYFRCGYSVKNLDTLNNDIKSQFFNRASTSKAMKAEFLPFDYYKSKNNEDRLP